MESLRPEWDAACSGLCDAEVADKWWAIMSRKYGDKDRIYHNHGFLTDLFRQYHQHKTKFSDPQAFALSIFFHKLEYDPRTADGETQSLEQFKAFLAEAGEDCQCSEVATNALSLLEACSSNLTEAHLSPGDSGSEDHHYLLDMTLGRLGADAVTYRRHVEDIRAEYGHLTPQEYSKLRSKILQSLLLIPNIYATKEFQECYEKQARANIAAEIENIKEK